MAYEVNLPRLGWDMEEGNLAGWLKQDGDFVKEGELLFSVEGDKAVQEIEALDNGYLRILPDCPKPGQIVPVGTILGYLVPKEELESFKFPKDENVPQSPEKQEQKKTMEPALQDTQQAATLDDSAAKKKRIYISPYARRLAEGLGVNWRSLKGSGRAGRIIAKDVKAAITVIKASDKAAETDQKAVSVAVVPAPAMSEALAQTRIPMTQIRKKIAEQMAASAHTTAPVTLTTEVDCTELVSFRKHLKGDSLDEGPLAPSYNDMLAKITAHALLEHPWMNARIEGDEILQSNSVHVAIAVETERGLLVPVLRDVQTKTLRQIASESAQLIDNTRLGAVELRDLQGATITITNLGMYEIDAFTPIIDLPQCAIIGVGQIVPKPVVIDVEQEKVSIRQRMVLSLTFDHRLVDGAQAARFLQRVKQLIEKPYLWLAG